VDGDAKEAIDLNVDRRRDAVHVFGSWINSQSTKSLLQWFDTYGPVCVEWINFQRCNIVFGDAGSAARAIVCLPLSVFRPLLATNRFCSYLLMQIGLSRVIPSAWKAVEEQAKSLNITPVEGSVLVWRLGRDNHPRQTQFLRLATIRDTKKPLSERSKEAGFHKFVFITALTFLD